MISILKRILEPVSPHRAAADALYRKAVEKARDPAFYRALAVPDTIDGRFDMIVLHTALTVRRLRDDERGREVAQVLFDLMFSDFDRSLRELGVGDLSVGKHIKKMGRAWYGRAAAYDTALDAGAENPQALAAALRETVYRANPVEAEAAQLAAYVIRAVAHLAGQSVAEIAAGAVDWQVPVLEPTS